MQRGRLLVFLGLLLLLGVSVLALVFFLRGGGLTPPEPTPVVTPAPAVEMTQVVIAVQPIERGQEIRAEALAMAPWPVGSLPTTAITDMALVIGRLARSDIERGEPILSTRITENVRDLSSTGSEAALKIPEGRVAVTIPLTRLSGVGYALREGDHVNVLVSLLFTDLVEESQSVMPDSWVMIVKSTDPETQVTSFTSLDLGAAGTFLDDNPFLPEGQIIVRASESPRPRLVVQQIVQDAVVLKVGTFTDKDVVIALPSPTPLPEGSPPPPPTPIPPPDIITLIVTPQDALVLNYFMFANARFTLVLRAANDTAPQDTESVTLQYAVERFRISVPTPLNFGLEPAIRDLTTPILPNEAPPVIIPLPDGRFICGGANCP